MQGKDSALQLPYCGSSRKLATGGDGHAVTTGAYAPITMNGKKVYTFACREVPTVITEALANAGLTIDDVDWVLLHQANIRIMQSVAEKLGVSFDKVLTNLSEYGNTSAGSIPLALEEAVSNGKVKTGDVIVCAGFGAGLSWGAAVLRWGEAGARRLTTTNGARTPRARAPPGPITGAIRPEDWAPWPTTPPRRPSARSTAHG